MILKIKNGETIYGGWHYFEGISSLNTRKVMLNEYDLDSVSRCFIEEDSTVGIVIMAQIDDVDVGFVTNVETYLLNDQGETIERLC